MKNTITLEEIVKAWYHEIIEYFNYPIDYDALDQKVRLAFANNHRIFESSLNESSKILIPEEDAAMEKIDIKMELGWISRDRYHIAMDREMLSKHNR